MSDTPTAATVVLGRWEKPGNLASIAALAAAGQVTILPHELIRTTDGRVYHWTGTALEITSAPVHHGTVADIAALDGVYLLPSCTRGVHPGDTAYVTASACEYRVTSGINATATWAACATIPTSASAIGADPAGTASDEVSAHNTAPDSHSDLRTHLDGKQDALTISTVGTALLNLPAPSAPRLPLIAYDGSVSYITVPSGAGGGGMVWSSLTSSSTLEAVHGYISSPDLIHALPAAISGASVRVCTTSGWCLLLPVSGDVFRAGGTTLPSGSGWGGIVSSVELVCVVDGYWDVISSGSISLGHSALPIVPMWCMYRAEDYTASTGVWVDRGNDPRDLLVYGGTAPVKNIGPVFAGSGTVLHAAAKQGTSDCSMLVVLSSTSTAPQGVISRAVANNGSNLPGAMIGYPSAGAWTAMAGNGQPTAWHASTTSGTIGTSLKSTFVSFSNRQWDQYFYINGAATTWSTSYGAAQANVPITVPMYVGGDPGGDNGPMRGEITDIYVWPVQLTASQRTQALEYVRALRGLY